MWKLNLGAGFDIREGFDNLDEKDFDFNKFPYPIKSNIYDYILVQDVLEHLDYPDKVLKELWRICKNKAIIKIIVPHYTHKSAYNSLQHKHYFNDTAFKEFIAYNSDYFQIKLIKLTPTILGLFIPFRRFWSHYQNGLIGSIIVEYEVVK